MKVLFLDIDGVLNGHEWDDEARSCNIRRECVKRLGRVVAATGCRVVVSSAWRYMVLGGAMTLLGFAYMLRTHGLLGTSNIIGTTEPDEECEGGGMRDRGLLVRRWLDAHPEAVVHLAVDDDDFDFEGYGVRVLRTDGARGLTDADVARAVCLLGSVRKHGNASIPGARRPG